MVAGAVSSGLALGLFLTILGVVLHSPNIERLERRATIGLFAFFLLAIGALVGLFAWGLQD